MANKVELYKRELERMRSLVGRILEGEDNDADDLGGDTDPQPVAAPTMNPALSYPAGASALPADPMAQFSQPGAMAGMPPIGVPAPGSSAITATMNSGDPSLVADQPMLPGAMAPFAPPASGAAPGASAVPASIPASDTSLTDEEMQVVEAFRKFKASKLKEKKGITPELKEKIKAKIAARKAGSNPKTLDEKKTALKKIVAERLAAKKKQNVLEKYKALSKKLRQLESELDEPVIDDPLDLMDDVTKNAMKNNVAAVEAGNPVVGKMEAKKESAENLSDRRVNHYIERAKLNFDKLRESGVIG